MQTLSDVQTHNALDVIRRAPPRLATLNIDDRAERALIRAAASGVETGRCARRQLDSLCRQPRKRRAFKLRQIIHEIVKRLYFSGEHVAQHLAKTTLGFTGEQTD